MVQGSVVVDGWKRGESCSCQAPGTNGKTREEEGRTVCGGRGSGRGLDRDRGRGCGCGCGPYKPDRVAFPIGYPDHLYMVRP